MLCGGLDGMGIWWRMTICICMAEFQFFRTVPPETITTLLISYTPTRNKRFNLKKDAGLKKELILQYIQTILILYETLLIKKTPCPGWLWKESVTK